MAFSRIVIKRLLWLVMVVLGVFVITFVVSHLIPGDPVRLLAGERAKDEIVTNMRHLMGLDRPLYVQFWRYLNGLLHGDLGTSIRTSRPVLEDLRAFFPATLELALVALFFATLLGIPLGVLSAVYRNKWVDQAVRTLAVSGISTPAFWLGLTLIVVFYGKWGLLPGSARIAQEIDPPGRITGLYLVDSLLTHNRPALVSSLQHLILPAFTLGFVQLGAVARQIRSSMLEQLNEDYIRTARANGLTKRAVILRHALPNSLIPSVIVLGLTLGDRLRPGQSGRGPGLHGPRPENPGGELTWRPRSRKPSPSPAAGATACGTALACSGTRSAAAPWRSSAWASSSWCSPPCSLPGFSRRGIPTPSISGSDCCRLPARTGSAPTRLAATCTAASFTAAACRSA